MNSQRLLSTSFVLLTMTTMMAAAATQSDMSITSQALQETMSRQENLRELSGETTTSPDDHVITNDPDPIEVAFRNMAYTFSPTPNALTETETNQIITVIENVIKIELIDKPGFERIERAELTLSKAVEWADGATTITAHGHAEFTEVEGEFPPQVSNLTDVIEQELNESLLDALKLTVGFESFTDMELEVLEFTLSPSESPSEAPSSSPSRLPSVTPVATPSVSPVATPSVSPSLSPSQIPSKDPASNIAAANTQNIKSSGSSSNTALAVSLPLVGAAMIAVALFVWKKRRSVYKKDEQLVNQDFKASNGELNADATMDMDEFVVEICTDEWEKSETV